MAGLFIQLLQLSIELPTFHLAGESNYVLASRVGSRESSVASGGPHFTRRFISRDIEAVF